jgi:uncharacterized protein (TIGR02466 family)
MQMPINKVFSIPIYENTINYQLDVSTIDFLHEQSLDIQKNSHKGMNSFVGYNSNDKILDAPMLSGLKQQIEIEIKQFIKDYGMDQEYWYIGKSWITITSPGGRINMHNHTGHGGIVSGVFYIDAPADCGDIVFTNPYPFRDRMPFVQMNDLNTSFFKRTPANGTLLLWPSSLNHQTDANMSNQTRLSISLDIFHVSGNLISPLKTLLDNITHD